MVSVFLTFLAVAGAVEYNIYPKLPKFLSNNPLPAGYPWGAANATNTNPFLGAPETGVTRHYELEISRRDIAPDGVNKSGLLVNGQFPGPLLEANWGDTFQIQVTNNIADEGTALHWHGQHQRLSPAYDGVPSVSQCPIAPGKNFTYTFRAENYGTSWYHSHFSGQYMDGAFGPMIIYGPRTPKYDEDLGPVLLADHYHVDYYDSVRRALTVPQMFDVPVNSLINGRMDANCLSEAGPSNPNNTRPCDPKKLVHFEIHPNKTYLLRLINTGSVLASKFSIDGHSLTVIANDYVAIKPYETKVVTLGVGQRSDVLLRSIGQPKDLVWMRSWPDYGCYDAPIEALPRALGVVSYPDAPKHAVPQSEMYLIEDNNCRNDPLDLTTPEYEIKPPEQVATTQMAVIDFLTNDTGISLWNVNNSTFRGNYNHPILFLSKLGNTSYPDSPQWNVYNFGSNNSIRVVLQNFWPLPHPMHLHGHDFWVLAEGQGTWDGSIVNPHNPQRRDTQIIAPGTPENPSYLVVEWEADNPGIWPLHCHVVADVGLGLYINVIERPDDIVKRDIPHAALETCREWWTFTNSSFVNQIDSGL